MDSNTGIKQPIEGKRVLYFKEEENGNSSKLIKLSDMLKNDKQTQIEILYNYGNVLWKKEEWEKSYNAKIETNYKLKQPEQFFSSSSDGVLIPTIHLLKFLVKNILVYLDNKKLISECIYLNKYINGLFNITLTYKQFENDKLVHAGQNKSLVHSEFDCIDYIDKGEILTQVKITLESKDQGWASAPESSSWVELKFLNKGTGEVNAVIPIAKNYREKCYKTYNIVFTLNQSDEYQTNVMNNFSNLNNKVEVLARCMFPGWECYLKNVKIDFKCLNIDRTLFK